MRILLSVAGIFILWCHPTSTTKTAYIQTSYTKTIIRIWRERNSVQCFLVEYPFSQSILNSAVRQKDNNRRNAKRWFLFFIWSIAGEHLTACRISGIPSLLPFSFSYTTRIDTNTPPPFTLPLYSAMDEMKRWCMKIPGPVAAEAGYHIVKHITCVGRTAPGPTYQYKNAT